VGLTRPAQNPFTFVSFDYTQLDRRRGGAINSAVSTSSFSSTNDKKFIGTSIGADTSLSVINATAMLLNIVVSAWNLSMDALNVYGVERQGRF